MHVDDGGALVMSSVLLSEGKLHLVQERQRFGGTFGILRSSAALRGCTASLVCVAATSYVQKMDGNPTMDCFPECVAKGEGFSLIFGGVFGCVRSMLWPGEVHVHQRGMDGAR